MWQYGKYEQSIFGEYQNTRASQESTLSLFKLQDDLAIFFFMKHFYLKEMTGKLWLFRLRYLTDFFFFKLKEVSLSLANVKISAFKWNLEYWKICNYYCELDIFQFFKTFLMIFSGKINKFEFWHFIMKYNIWKICVTQWTNIF